MPTVRILNEQKKSSHKATEDTVKKISQIAQMSNTKFSPSRRRNRAGNAMAEFGPALGLLLICFFFPMMDMLALGIAYGFVQVLNSNQAHEAALLPSAQAAANNGAVKKGVPDAWLDGMGKFVKMASYPQTEVFYRDGTTDQSKSEDKIVMVRTTVVCQPFLPIPMPVVNVPGLNGNMTFTVSAERPMENPDYAP